MMKRNTMGNILIVAGCIFILGGLGFLYKNSRESQEAGKAANTMLVQVKEQIYMQAQTTERQDNYTLDFPVIDGVIGVLSLPSLKLTLPVQADYDLEAIKIAPCRYRGEEGEIESLVIAAHNYPTHFGELKKIKPKDEIVFTNGNGIDFLFTVIDLDTIAGNDYKTLQTGEWDMALFTCTLSGNKRVIVYCALNSMGN